MSDGLSAGQRQEAEDVAELKVRRYFDEYLKTTFPESVAAMIQAHNTSPEAHGGVVAQVLKAKYLFMGFAAAGGFGAAKLIDLL